MRRMDESRREMVMSDGKLVDALWSCSVWRCELSAWNM